MSSATEEVTHSRAFGLLLSAGLIVYGGVHLVIAWLFVMVAWSSPGDGLADRPITAMARSTSGRILLWIAGIGMALLVLWRLWQVLLRFTDPGSHKPGRPLSTVLTWLFEAVIYALIAISAVQAALTDGRRGSVQGEGESERSLGATLLAHWWGRVVVMIIAAALLALGIALFRSAVTRSFTSDLRPGVGRPLIWAGAIGTFVKGIALVIICGLIAWAAISFDPSKTGGLEAMIDTLRGEPFGSALLTALGGGLALYGCYCFAWSTHASHSGRP